MCKYPTSFAVQDSVTANNDREPPPSSHCSSKWLMRNCLLAVVKAITFSSEVLALATCVNQFICHKACLKGILTQGGITILLYYWYNFLSECIRYNHLAWGWYLSIVSGVAYLSFVSRTFFFFAPATKNETTQVYPAKQVGCFNHRVVTLVTDKLERLVMRVLETNCARKLKKKL